MLSFPALAVVNQMTFNILLYAIGRHRRQFCLFNLMVPVMISFTPVFLNDVYVINFVVFRNFKGICVSSHYELNDLIIKKCLAICDDLEESRKKMDSLVEKKQKFQLSANVHDN